MLMAPVAAIVSRCAGQPGLWLAPPLLANFRILIMAFSCFYVKLIRDG